MDIDHLRNQHINAQAHTPLSRTPCIIPITHARLWSNDGFTLAFWLQMKGAHNSKPSSLHMEDEARSTQEDSHVSAIKPLIKIVFNIILNIILFLENTHRVYRHQSSAAERLCQSRYEIDI